MPRFYGAATLPADPANPLEAATKQYVDGKSAVTVATDFNACTTTGLYSISNTATNGIGIAQAAATGILQVFAIDATHVTQVWFGGNNSAQPEIWTRSNNAGTWCRWESVYGRPNALGDFGTAYFNGIYTIAGTATGGPGVTGQGLLTMFGNTPGVVTQTNGVQTWTSFVTGEIWQRQFSAAGAYSAWSKIGPSPLLSTITTKGDLYVGTAASAVARQGVGTDGQHLVADSTQPTGVGWGAALGYATGMGGAVTQLTSRTTAVTLNKICGQITLFSAAGLTTWTNFPVNNTLVAAGDVIVLSVQAATNYYIAHPTVLSAGAFRIAFTSVNGTSTDAPIINFGVIKAVKV